MWNRSELESIISGLIGITTTASYLDRLHLHLASSATQISIRVEFSPMAGRVASRYRSSHSHGCNGTGSGIAIGIES